VQRLPQRRGEVDLHFGRALVAASGPTHRPCALPSTRAPLGARAVPRPPDEPTACRSAEGGNRRQARVGGLAAGCPGRDPPGCAALLREGQVHPQLVVLAAARVASGLGAGAALVSGTEVEMLLGELAEVVRLAGREHAKALRAEALPVAGSV
jgi:hypothetical protein